MLVPIHPETIEKVTSTASTFKNALMKAAGTFLSVSQEIAVKGAELAGQTLEAFGNTLIGVLSIFLGRQSSVATAFHEA